MSDLAIDSREQLIEEFLSEIGSIAVEGRSQQDYGYVFRADKVRRVLKQLAGAVWADGWQAGRGELLELLRKKAEEFRAIGWHHSAQDLEEIWQHEVKR